MGMGTRPLVVRPLKTRLTSTYIFPLLGICEKREGRVSWLNWIFNNCLSLEPTI